MTAPDPDTEARPAEPERRPGARTAEGVEPADGLPHPYRLPAARRIGLRRRRELAAFWLERLGRPVTAEAVDALAPVAGRYPTGSYARQEADKLLRGGHIPHPSLVDERLRERAARDAARSQAVATERSHAAADLQRYRDETIWFIAHWRREHDRGPAWSELTASLGWTRAQTQARLHALKRAGHVTYTTQKHSLNVTQAEADPRPHDEQSLTVGPDRR